MGKVVCATRAGEHSRAVHRVAIEAVAGTDDEVLFVHVLGTAAYRSQPPYLQEAIRLELEWLLNALVRLAQDQTGAEHLNAEILVREGDLLDEIINTVVTSDASTLVMGHPQAQPHTSFPAADIDELRQRVASTGAELILVGRDD